MTPEARQLEELHHERFSDMRCIPTHHWAQHPEIEWHPLVRFVFIAREYGVDYYRPVRMGPDAAIAHFEKRLAAAQCKAA